MQDKPGIDYPVVPFADGKQCKACPLGFLYPVSPYCLVFVCMNGIDLTTAILQFYGVGRFSFMIKFKFSSLSALSNKV